MRTINDAGLKLIKEFTPEVFDLTKAECAVEFQLAAINIHRTTMNQFSALVSFTYDRGEGDLRKLIRFGIAPVPARIMNFNRVGSLVIKGMTRRREAERDLFLRPDGQLSK